MAQGFSRRDFGKTVAAAAVATALPRRSARADDDKKTLRFIAQSDLRVLDPIWTTAYITRNHGYMVFDTLFAIDEEFAPHPQMVGDYDVSADKLSYHFTLRDGLGFHDGSPVRGADLLDPAGNPALRTNGKKGHFGWPSDDKVEALRVEWMKATSAADRKKLAEAIQTRAFEIVPYIPTGQWFPKTAFRKNVKGIITAPAFLMWNVEKV